MSDPVWLSDVEQRRWQSVVGVMHRLPGALARRLAARSHMSYQDYQVLVALTDDACQPVRAADLSRLLGWDQSRVSHHVARMARRGLVERRRCDRDGRAFYLSATESGAALLAAAAPGHVADVRELCVDVLSPSELEVFAVLCDKVLAAVDASPPGSGTDPECS